MVSVVLRLIFQVQGGDGIGDEINVDDVDLVVRAKRQRRQSRQEDKRLHHVELSGLGMAAVAENDAGAKNRLGRIRKQNVSHVFAEFLGAGVGIIVGTIPLDRLIFS